jgi:putative DNA primase/helicase
MRAIAHPDMLALAHSVRIEDVIASRGIKLHGRIDRCGPCPRCGGTDRFSINIAKQVFNCRGSGGGDVIALVRHLDGCDFRTAVRTLAGERSSPALASTLTSRMGSAASSRTGVDDYERNQRLKAARLWARRRPMRGTFAENYLRRRGITCPLPPTLGYLPRGKPEHHPALIAAFAVADEVEPGMLGEPRNVGAVHLTLLTPNGLGKAEVKPNKLIVGSPGTLPITLAPPNDLLAMAIAEGIEDALAPENYRRAIDLKRNANLRICMAATGRLDACHLDLEFAHRSTV